MASKPKQIIEKIITVQNVLTELCDCAKKQNFSSCKNVDKCLECEIRQIDSLLKQFAERA